MLAGRSRNHTRSTYTVVVAAAGCTEYPFIDLGSCTSICLPTSSCRDICELTTMRGIGVSLWITDTDVLAHVFPLLAEANKDTLQRVMVYGIHSQGSSRRDRPGRFSSTERGPEDQAWGDDG